MSRFRHLFTMRHPSQLARAARLALRCASLPYRCVVGIRNAGYSLGWLAAENAGLPVVSIGNLSVGGTGKSPMVAWIARWLRDRDKRVAILSRGYGQLDSGQNDEALELELRLPDVPHLQHWDRIASAKLAREELEMQVLVLDDGFQHRRLARDLDIVLIDATDPPPARHVLPGGLLREPLSGLRRSSLIVITRADQVGQAELNRLSAELQRVAPGKPILKAMHRPCELWLHPQETRSLETLRGTRVLAFCGIGNPDSFFSTLVELGADVVDRRIFPDHHAYTADDVASIAEWAENHTPPLLLVCTLKDWVKLQTRRIGRTELAALIVDLSFDGNTQPLEEMLERLITTTSEPPRARVDIK